MCLQFLYLNLITVKIPIIIIINIELFFFFIYGYAAHIENDFLIIFYLNFNAEKRKYINPYWKKKN